MNPKCIKCGLVNWPLSESCKRCGAKLEAESSDGVSPEPGNVKERRRIIVGNPIVFLVGLFGSFVFLLVAIAGGSASVPLAIAFTCLGTLFGYFRPKSKWQVGIWLSLSYLVLIVWLIIGTLQYNAKWEGVFWRTEIFYTTIYLYLCPVLASFLGALLGSTRSFRFVAALIVVLGVAVGCENYRRDHSQISRSKNGFIDIRSEDSWLRIDISCVYTKSIDYRGFRYFDVGGCSDSRTTVVNKNPSYSLPTKAMWVIDGQETPEMMSPLNGRDGTSTIYTRDEHANDEVLRWRSIVPIRSMMNAHQVEFRWGAISIPLQNEQLEALKNLQKEFEQLCKGA